jgi:hypothetical protein
MSPLAQKTTTDLAGPAEVIVRHGHAPRTHTVVPRTWLALTWSISRAAAVAAGLVALDGAGEPVLELRVPWDSGSAQGSAEVSARLLDDGTVHALNLEAVRPGAWVNDPAAGLAHLDLPGLVQVSVRMTDGVVSVLYARTEVLGRLGLAGGRYDFQGAAVVAEQA